MFILIIYCHFVSVLFLYSDNKVLYTNIINDLLDYYDNETLIELSKVRPNANGKYNLKRVAEYKEIKDALNESLAYLEIIT